MANSGTKAEPSSGLALAMKNFTLVFLTILCVQSLGFLAHGRLLACKCRKIKLQEVPLSKSMPVLLARSKSKADLHIGNMFLRKEPSILASKVVLQGRKLNSLAPYHTQP
jgi:hypothetical protein